MCESPSKSKHTLVDFKYFYFSSIKIRLCFTVYLKSVEYFNVARCLLAENRQEVEEILEREVATVVARKHLADASSERIFLWGQTTGVNKCTKETNKQRTKVNLFTKHSMCDT